MRGSWWRQLNDFLRAWRPSKTARVTARVPADLVARIDRVAALLDRSRTDVVENALELYLEQADDLVRAFDRLAKPAAKSALGKRSNRGDDATD